MENREGYKKTELGWIPEEWRVVKLGEIAEFRNGKAHEQDINEQGEYVVVNSKFISTDGAVVKYTTQNICPLFSGNIVMVMSDVPNGRAFAKCFLIKEDNKYTLNQRICSIIAVKIDNLFLLNVLNRNKYYLQFDNGVGQTNLKKNEVLECPIPLPPLPEQQKIASILTTVDDKISSIEAQIQQTEQLKKGLMAKLLTEGIGHTEFKDTEIGRIPKEWEVKNIGDLVSFSGGAQPPRKTFIFEPKEGYIRLIQIRDYKTDKYQTYIPINVTNKFCTKKDIMIGRYGPPIFQILRGIDGAYNVALIKAIPKDSINNSYLWFFLNQSKLFYFIENLSQRSSGQTGVDMEKLKSYPLPLPPLPEQQQIASILSSVDDKLDVLQSKKSAYTTLKKGLMAKLLTGQLRVKI